jgi:hypothetical protein
MNTQKPGPLEADSGVASGSRENMTGPHEWRLTENRLHDVDLATRGEFLEDQQRDRDSKGVAGGYDDSLATRKDNESDRYGVSRGD